MFKHSHFDRFKIQYHGFTTICIPLFDLLYYSKGHFECYFELINYDLAHFIDLRHLIKLFNHHFYHFSFNFAARKIDKNHWRAFLLNFYLKKKLNRAV